MAAENSFDMELFIEEVHKLPCLWDYTTPDYSNRIEKAKAWECLCSKFYVNLENKGKKDKNMCIIRLQRKWKSLRDSYNRELKKGSILKNGSGESKHRQYLYFNNLYFLKPLAERRATQLSIDTHNNAEERSITYNSTKERRKVIKRKVSETSDQENKLLKKIPPCLFGQLNQQDNPVNHIDSDLHFLLSLYDRFKTIDSHMKLQTQIEILNVIRKYNQTDRQIILNRGSLGRRLEDHFTHGDNGISHKSMQHPVYSQSQNQTKVNPPEVNLQESSPDNSPRCASTQVTDNDSIWSYSDN